VYTLSGGSWVFSQRITLADSGSNFSQSSNHLFGWSVATNGSTILIGAPGDDFVATDAGACYEYVLSGGTWIQAATSDHGRLTISGMNTRMQFGFCASSNNSAYAIGTYPYYMGNINTPDPSAEGKAYVCGRDGSGNWQIANLTNPSGSPAGEGFGISVAIGASGRTIVGANETSISSSHLGQAYIFEPDSGTWSWTYNAQAIQPTSPNGSGSHDWFGAFVAIQDLMAMVAAPFGDVAGTADTGLVYFFGGCYANCDGSTASPLLTTNDFQCFMNAYNAGSSYANCDGSTTSPVLTANDFQCYLNKYSSGCS
jgi:hypothetical protein